MVFAFLPTAVLMVVSLLSLFLGGLAAAVDFSSMWLWTITLTAAGIAGIILSLKASDKLYKNSMLICNEDFDRWFFTQRKIAFSSFGGYKIAVLLNMIYVMCAHEKLDSARRALVESKAVIQASGNAYYRYCYLAQTIAVKEKTHDFAYMDELFSEAYHTLELAGIPKPASKESYMLKYRYSSLGYEFYRSYMDSKTVSETLAEQFNTAAKQGLADIGGLAEAIGYEALAYAYNIALSDLFTGRKQEAENCFEFIASSQCSFPLVKRVREYLLTKDISVLFSMIP